MLTILILAAAQIINPPAMAIPADVARAADVEAAQTQAAQAAAAIEAIRPQLCPPSSSVPGMEMVGGAAGSAPTCRRSDAVQPRISRTATCTIPAGASSCTGTWEGGAFPAGTMLRLTGDPAPTNTGTQPITCNASAITVTSVTVRCWIAQTSLVSILGATVSPFSTSTAGTVVQAVAIPSS